MACAKAGAAVTHVDASKGMVTWAKENAAASGLADAPICYLVDDCVKFVEREIRPLAPHGKTSPLLLTGSPISSAVTCPPNGFPTANSSI